MPTQTQSGKALEYALTISLFNKIKTCQDVELVMDSLYKNAQECFNVFDENEKQQYRIASEVAIKHIWDLEPRLSKPLTKNSKIKIMIQSDQRGVIGDVRDIVTISSDDNWEIGFSAKNRNDVVKNSRLSDKIDFGKEWLGIPCSDTYMNKVRQIFGKLRDIKEHTRYWNQLDNKETDFYVPVLCALQEELARLSTNHIDVPELLIS